MRVYRIQNAFICLTSSRKKMPLFHKLWCEKCEMHKHNKNSILPWQDERIKKKEWPKRNKNIINIHSKIFNKTTIIPYTAYARSQQSNLIRDLCLRFSFFILKNPFERWHFIVNISYKWFLHWYFNALKMAKKLRTKWFCWTLWMIISIEIIWEKKKMIKIRKFTNEISEKEIELGMKKNIKISLYFNLWSLK